MSRFKGFGTLFGIELKLNVRDMNMVVFAIAMPLCQGIYAGQINPVVMASLATVLASCAWSTAPSSPISAISYGSGWVRPGDMIKWGFITSMLCVLTAMTVGLAIGNAF